MDDVSQLEEKITAILDSTLKARTACAHVRSLKHPMLGIPEVSQLGQAEAAERLQQFQHVLPPNPDFSAARDAREAKDIARTFVAKKLAYLSGHADLSASRTNAVSQAITRVELSLDAAARELLDLKEFLREADQQLP
jgi:hypothetical protein